jgi:AcrR family transcriptional regulator
MATLARMTQREPESGTAADGHRADALRNRAAILDAAAGVLAEDPSASLATVARRAGLGRATLYRHFPSREALREAIRDEALARAAAALQRAALDTVPAREGVRRAAEVLVPLGVRFRVLLADGADLDPEFLAARDRALAPLFALVARAVGEDDVAEPGWAGLVLANLLVTAVRAAGSGVIDPAEAGELVSRTLFDGIAGAAPHQP